MQNRDKTSHLAIAQCVRWYLAYSLSLRNLEDIMAERGIVVDHSTLHRWVIRLVPRLDKAFRRYKRNPGRRWRMDETYIRVRGQWKYLYRTVDSTGQTIDFLQAARWDAAAALHFFHEAQTILADIKLIHLIRKEQHPKGDGLLPAEQFYLLVA